MTTKASTTKKRSRAIAATASKVNGKSVRLEILNLAIGKIKPDPEQPRKTFDEKHLEQLSKTIKEHGVLQPITVRKSGKDFIIVMGERRFRTSKIAKKKTVPCIVRDYENNEVLEVQIIENLQRQNVETTEEAEAIAYLSEKSAPTEIAKRLGRTNNFIRQR
ncbi:MAG: ParB/RepB/Spo0J family partition protein [Pricia sp.]